MKFIYWTYHVGIWLVTTFTLLLIGVFISWVFDVSLLVGLHVVVLAILVDIQMEVDGIARTKKYSEKIVYNAVNDREEVSVDRVQEGFNRHHEEGQRLAGLRKTDER